MSVLSSFATQVDGFGPPLFVLLIARKPERTQIRFLNTIAGHRGGLRSILAEVHAVASTNATV